MSSYINLAESVQHFRLVNFQICLKINTTYPGEHFDTFFDVTKWCQQTSGRWFQILEHSHNIWALRYIVICKIFFRKRSKWKTFIRFLWNTYKCLLLLTQFMPPPLFQLSPPFIWPLLPLSTNTAPISGLSSASESSSSYSGSLYPGFDVELWKKGSWYNIYVEVGIKK